LGEGKSRPTKVGQSSQAVRGRGRGTIVVQLVIVRRCWTKIMNRGQKLTQKEVKQSPETGLKKKTGTDTRGNFVWGPMVARRGESRKEKKQPGHSKGGPMEGGVKTQTGWKKSQKPSTQKKTQVGGAVTGGRGGQKTARGTELASKR